ncbi:MAG: AmmeMemoRadiSam system radical SAM enzyme [Nitrospiraceae bacterium]|nr:AmmeMemoRadiSam system radical SAM enzyme [Nitrospiraceae bacterium]
MKEAMFYERLEDKKVRCFLCAHNCQISNGKRGICYVRENIEGRLYSLVYGRLISINIDPIEKKPLFHFLPGSKSLSIAAAGCNFRCGHCQNYEISQYPRINSGQINGKITTPEEVVDMALRNECQSISYTYTEPTIFFEFAYDCAKLAHEKNIKNVFVSNGYTSPEAAMTIAPYLDGNNIDFKGDEKFYQEICGAKAEPVKKTIKLMKKLGIWVEVTTLIIPNHNDSEESLKKIAEFISSIDSSIPWHVSKFYPTYKLTDLPSTPVKTLKMAYEIGLNNGLKYVYEGNIPGEGGENTYCPKCKTLLIERIGYRIFANNIKDGLCPKCNTGIKGIWS